MSPQTVTMFGNRLSPFVEKVWRALALKGVPARLVEPTGPADFRRWNPQTRKMPVLEMDGERTYDSSLILRRLERSFPAPPLLADDPQVAALQRLLEDWSDESLYWYGMALRWNDKNAPRTAAQIFAGLSPVMRSVARVVAGRQIAATARAQGLGRLPDGILLDELRSLLDDLATILGKRPYFFDDRISVADLAVYGQFRMLRSGPTPEAAGLLDERPALLQHMRWVEDETGGA